MKLNLVILAIGLTVTPGAFGAPVTLNPSDEALSKLTKRYYYLTCDNGWIGYCEGAGGAHCDASSGLFFASANICYEHCLCDYAGIYSCHGCYVAEGSANTVQETGDTVQETGATVTNSKAEATRI